MLKQLLNYAGKYLTIFTVACIAMFPSPNTSWAEDARYPQHFHTEGNKIVDEGGNQVVLRGVNALDPLAQATWGEAALGEWGEQYFVRMKKFGSEVVRIPIHPETWRTTDEKYAILDKTIAWIGNQKMYAIIDYHSIGDLSAGRYETKAYETSKEEILTFWTSIARRYGQNDIVAFYDIFNEPVNLRNADNDYDPAAAKVAWRTWKKDAEEIIDAIRTVDEDSVIIVGGMNWSYDLSQVTANPINRDNIVYDVHPYPGKIDYLPWEKAFGDVAKIYPVFAGEIGFWSKREIREMLSWSGVQPDDDTWNPTYLEGAYDQGVYRDDLIKFLNKYNIGWAAWNFSPAWGPVLLKNWGNTLSESGKFFKQQLSKKSPH